MAENHHLATPDGRDLVFEGELLVEHAERSSGRIRIFRTQSGKIVAEQVRSALRGTQAIFTVQIVDDLADLHCALDGSEGAKEVLRDLGAMPTITI